MSFIAKSLTQYPIFTGTLIFGVIVLTHGTVAQSNHHSSPQIHHQENHSHNAIAIPEDQPIPTVDLIVHEDALKGWNLEIQVSNFKFAPEKVNQASNNYSEGHGHLYVNGEKITRLYSNWYYLEQLKPGRNQITVRLNTNEHQMLMYQQQRIEDTEIIEVK